MSVISQSELTELQTLQEIRKRKREILADIERLKSEIALCTNEIDFLDSSESGNNSEVRNKLISIAKRKFNSDASKGIDYLVENRLIQRTPQDVAVFLYRGGGLSKTAIGTYLGEKDDFNVKVLNSFADLHDFRDIQLVEALRQFLYSFRLPGEGQKIDRMMECFANRYFQCNPHVFSSANVVHVLSYAIVILNTSLHNKNAKNSRISFEEFVRMVHETIRVDQGDVIPSYDLIQKIYESVKSEPFKLPEEDRYDVNHIFFNPDKEGWLYKQGGNIRTWKRRWFILARCCLYYFEYTTDKIPRGIIPLAGLSVRDILDKMKPHCFEIYPLMADRVKACKTNDIGRILEGNHTVYRLSAPTHLEKLEWISALQNAMQVVVSNEQNVLAF